MQIPCEYDQLLVSNKYDTRRGGVEFEATRWSQHDPFSGRELDLNPGPPEYKSSALPLGPTTRPRSPQFLVAPKFILAYGWVHRRDIFETGRFQFWRVSNVIRDVNATTSLYKPDKKKNYICFGRVINIVNKK